MSDLLCVQIDVDNTFCSSQTVTCPFFVSHPIDEYSCKIFGPIEVNKGRHRDCLALSYKEFNYQQQVDIHQNMVQRRVPVQNSQQFMEHSQVIQSTDLFQD